MGPGSGRGSRRPIIPYAILIVGLLVTAAAAWNAATTAALEDRFRFRSAADAVRSAIVSRSDAYIAMLLGGAGFFAASDRVHYEEFRDYVSRLSIPDRYPGIRGIGFSRVVRAAERDAVAADVRRFIPSFDYWPKQASDERHAIIYLEPQDARNRRAMGFDMWSEPVRRAAMTQARDTGEPAATRRARLVQEDEVPESEQLGFLIYVPVYEGGDVPETVHSRRELLAGFIYAPFRGADLLRGVLSVAVGPAPTLQVFDGAPDAGDLLYQSDPVIGEGAELRRTLIVAGRPWTLVFRSRSAAPPFPGGYVTWLVVVGGTLLSGLLFVVMMTQIRARQSAERIAEELRRSEEALRAANQLRDEFLAMISHELRTPLNAIVGWATMLQKGQVPPQSQPHALSVIARNAAAQTRLVEDLLDVSSALENRLRLTHTDVDVRSLLTTAAESIHPDAEQHGVQIISRFPADLGTIRGDAPRLQQVLGNLLSNAVKFTPAGGMVRISARRERKELVVTVADTGIGIAEEFLPHAFDRFRQEDSSSTRAHPGVGLGLAIVRHLVELHGGTVTVESPGADQGTTFIVRLPVDGR
jgi:two-component system, OmpR family, sensor kinase